MGADSSRANLDHRALNEEIRKVLFRSLLTNRYNFHPSRVQEIASEIAASFLAYLGSADRAPVAAFGESLARSGLSVKSLMEISALFRRLLQGADAVESFAEALMEGYVSCREDQILSDQEQLRRALAAALETQSRDLLAKNQAIDSSINGIMIADMRGMVSYVNRSFLSMWGYATSGEVVGRLIDEFWADEESRKVVERFPLVGGWRGELTAKRRDGSLFTVALSTSYVRNAEGDAVGVMTFFVDVTESRRLELQMQQIQKMDDLGQLAGGIVHDFNNLLAAISGYLQLVLLEASAQGQMHQDLMQIKAAVDRGAGLTRQLGYFTRQATGKREVISLNNVAVETHELLKHTFPRNIEVKLDLAPSLGMVEADPNQMSQVIMNLCVNARDAIVEKGASADGGTLGTLSIETSNFELSEGAARQYVDVGAGRYVRLRITDTGVGIPPEVRSRLFVPFVTTKSKSRGTGLGLAVVYGIVRSHQGFIDVSSTLGEGTTFLVYLPMAGSRQLTRRGAASDIDLVQGEGTLLVVDDEEQVREVIARVLGRCGYLVLKAASGQEAIDCYGRHSAEIDLVILDMVMPQMNGHETLVRLKQMDPNVTALFITGYTSDGQLRKLAEQGLAQVLEKPVDLKVLSRRVRELTVARRPRSLT